MVKENKILECNIWLPCVVCNFLPKLSDEALAGEDNASIFHPLVSGDSFQCYGVWWRLLGIRNWIWKIKGYEPYQGNYWKMHFLLVTGLCRKFLHVPCHAMAWMTCPTKKVEEQFSLSNIIETENAILRGKKSVISIRIKGNSIVTNISDKTHILRLQILK